jgi:ribosomal protein S4
MPPIVFVVDRRENGKTLAAVLKTRYGLSWSQAKRLVEKRHVKVSGQVETDVARRLKVGKTVELTAGSIEWKESGDRAQETGDRGQRTEDRRQKTEDREQRTEVSLFPDLCLLSSDL